MNGEVFIARHEDDCATCIDKQTHVFIHCFIRNFLEAAPLCTDARYEVKMIRRYLPDGFELLELRSANYKHQIFGCSPRTRFPYNLFIKETRLMFCSVNSFV